jgi:hypothetical protein
MFFDRATKICDFLQFRFVQLPEACAEVKESKTFTPGETASSHTLSEGYGL